MKFTHSGLSLLVAGALAAGGLSSAAAQSAPSSVNHVVIPRPPVPDGSNASRAPFPSARPADDIKKPDGFAIDMNLPPNTPATREPAAPPAIMAVLQPAAPAEPTLTMTGRPTTGVADTLDATRVGATLRAQTFASRDAALADVDARLNASDSTLRSLRGSIREVSAGSQEQFRTATSELEEKQKALRASLKAAREASAQNWEAARAKMAADYDALAATAARVDAAAGISTVR